MNLILNELFYQYAFILGVVPHQQFALLTLGLVAARTEPQTSGLSYYTEHCQLER
jgi:hypothetical protein